MPGCLVEIAEPVQEFRVKIKFQCFAMVHVVSVEAGDLWMSLGSPPTRGPARHSVRKDLGRGGVTALGWRAPEGGARGPAVGRVIPGQGWIERPYSACIG